jgi:hypothetical protein
LAIRLDTATNGLSADVTITVPPQRQSFLLGRSFRISSVAAGPEGTARFGDVEEPFPGLQRIDLEPHPGADRNIDLKVSYAGPLGPVGDPPMNFVLPELVELSADSLWYPLPTVFSTRFTLDATVSGLRRDVVVASPDEVRMRPDGFTLRRVIPSQDVAFAASPHFKTVTAGQLQFFAEDLESPAARNYRENGAKALAYFTPWLGPLPRGKAVIAVIRRQNGAGYSRPGYLVVADTGKLPEPTKPGGNAWAEVGYIAHELSHGWWSNADFMSEDYWLVESTAEYVSLRFIEHDLGPDVLVDQLARKQARSAKGGPILGAGRPTEDAVYARGPLLLFGLEKTVGRLAVDKVLASLAQRPVITTADFLGELARAAGPGAARDFEVKLRAL